MLPQISNAKRREESSVVLTLKKLTNGRNVEVLQGTFFPQHISGQPQSAQLKTASKANAPNLQDDGMQYVTDNTLSSQ